MFSQECVRQQYLTEKSEGYGEKVSAHEPSSVSPAGRGAHPGLGHETPIGWWFSITPAGSGPVVLFHTERPKADFTTNARL
tara:strand:- start:299 stop:541 length:243 start_codon:yes stop_codon:yes gene_type:complete